MGSFFFEGYLDILSYDETLYAVPHYMFAPVMFYRPDLFEKYGIRIPTNDEPLTKDEFLDACITVTEGEGEDFYCTIVEAKRHVVPVIHMLEYIWREGGQIVDDAGVAHVNEEAAVLTRHAAAICRDAKLR